MTTPSTAEPVVDANPDPLPEVGCAEEDRRLDFAQVVLERVTAFAEVNGACRPRRLGHDQRALGDLAQRQTREDAVAGAQAVRLGADLRGCGEVVVGEP